ncbi:hypothetical protein A3K73_07495 [Candidatus Pacearchaeota archaeon RBG_13_36_9]|nr:MAG: hypothetical protein A3K73_07495 [Candidatus Pacearchaeota archaeon RBG_13_36_9]
MESELRQMNNEITKIRLDLDLIKGILMPKVDDEGELSDWAKEELDKSREVPLDKCISHEEAKKRVAEKCRGK